MSYEEQLACKKDGTLTIPVKIHIKENIVTIISRCPSCRKKHKAYLNMQERKEWLPLIRRLFLLCEVCEQPLSPNWRFLGGGAAFTSIRQFGHDLKLGNPCYNCRKNDMKVCSDLLWSEINPLPPPPPPTVTEGSIPPSKQFCTQCGGSLAPGVLFCSVCGTKV